MDTQHIGRHGTYVTYGPPTFSASLQAAFHEYGLGILDEPHRFMAVLMDQYSDSDLPAEMELLSRNCDRELLHPFAEAAGHRDAQALENARERTLLVLVQRKNDNATSQLFAQGMHEAICGYLGLPVWRYEPPMHEVHTAESPLRETAFVSDVNRNGDNRTHGQRHASNGILIGAVVVLALLVGGLFTYVVMQNFSAGHAQSSSAVTQDRADSAQDSVAQSQTTTQTTPTNTPIAEAPVETEVTTPPAPSATADVAPSANGHTSAQEGERLATTSEFWGIWTLASKDYDECAAYVSDVRAQGFSAYVTHTDLWSNLNDEPWYVVTIGTYASEGEAQAALPEVQGALDSTAYVKFSGAYEGGY